MIRALVEGVLLGIGAAAPIGPVNVEMARRTLTRGVGSGIALGLGAVTADGFYATLVGLGWKGIGNNRAVVIPIGIAGSLLLAYLGLTCLKSGMARVRALKAPADAAAASPSAAGPAVSPIAAEFAVADAQGVHAAPFEPTASVGTRGDSVAFDSGRADTAGGPGNSAESSAPLPIETLASGRNGAEGAYLTGLLMTLLNPMTLAWWFVAVPARVGHAGGDARTFGFTVVGVLLGALSWVLVFSGLISRVPVPSRPKALAVADWVGAVLLLTFAALAAGGVLREIW